MSDIKDISEEVLTKSIRDIISNADLNVMTAKLVRNELKTKLNVEDLDSRKKEINSIINDVISDLSKPNKSSPKIKTETKPETKPEIKPNTKKSADKSSDSSESNTDDDSEGGIDDESLARKLHNEELDSKRRSAKKVTKKTNKKKTKNGSDNSDVKPKKSNRNGYTKPCQLSSELAEFVGASEMPRHEVVKHMWAYAKDNNLFDPKNKQFAICDESMIKIIGRKRVRMFGIMKHLTKHFIK